MLPAQSNAKPGQITIATAQRAGSCQANPPAKRWLDRLRTPYTAALLAGLGIGLSLAVPFVLGGHLLIPGLRKLAWHVFAMLVASAALSAAAKAGKLHLLQGALGLRLGFARTCAVTLASDFGFLVSPLGAAGYAINLTLLKRAGATWAVATAVVSADQALDLVFFGIALPLGLLLALGPLNTALPSFNAATVISWWACVALAIALSWAARRRVAHFLDRATHRIAWLSARRSHWHRFRHTVRLQCGQLLAGGRWRLLALSCLTVLQWLLRYGALWFSLRELGYHLPLGLVLAVQAVVLHVALWTGLPAGGGSADLALAAVFSAWVPAAAMVPALLLWRFATLYCPLLLGAAGFAALAWRRHRARSPGAD